MIRSVSHQDIDHVWPVIEQWVKDACEYTDLINSNDVLKAIKARKMQCFVINDPISGVVVTEIEPYPRKTVLRVVALGGEGFDEWVSEVDDMLVKWAVSMDMKIESTGRKGWTRRLAPLGWKQSSVTVERVV